MKQYLNICGVDSGCAEEAAILVFVIVDAGKNTL
jgi:hypothetical protein